MNNIIDFIQEKLKISSQTKINKIGTFNEIPKREYTLLELGSTMYKKEERIGCYACFGCSFYDNYVKKYFDNDRSLKFYIIKQNTLYYYNKCIHDRIKLDNNLSVIEIDGFNKILDVEKSDHIIRIFKDDEENKILSIEAWHNESILKNFIIEKETFMKI